MKLPVNNYVMVIRASKQKYWIWCILSCFLHFVLAIILLRLSWSGIVIASLSIVSYIMSISLFLLRKDIPFQIMINEQGELCYKSQVEHYGILLNNSFSTSWFIWFSCAINHSGNSNNKRINVMIWQDALDNKSFRRLARIIRLKRQII